MGGGVEATWLRGRGPGPPPRQTFLDFLLEKVRTRKRRFYREARMGVNRGPRDVQKGRGGLEMGHGMDTGAKDMQSTDASSGIQGRRGMQTKNQGMASRGQGGY